MIASSNLSPPTRTDPLYTSPPSAITPTSVVPPPTSTTIEPVASPTGRSAPIAAAIGSSMRYTREARAPLPPRPGLFDELPGGSARADRRFADRASFDLGRAARHADDDPRRRFEQ